MKYLKLDAYAATLTISKFAFGTGSALRELSKEEFFGLFDLFAGAGGNCLDTAPGYNGGRSETYIGEWMKAHGNRPAMIISTKACHTFEGQPSRLSRQDMEDDVHQSLRQLQTDYVDVIWIHKDDPAWPVEEIVNNFNTLVQSGKVRAVGCSNWNIDRIEQANTYARANGLQGFLASQTQWSLARVEGEAYKKRYGALVMDDPSYDWYLKNNMPVFAFSSLAQGFFAVAAAGGLEALSEDQRTFFETPNNLVRLERVKAYMQKHNVPSSAPVLGYLINNKLPCVALMSATNPAILNEALLAADVEMSAAQADSLFAV